MDIQYRAAVKADRESIIGITDECINAEAAYHAYIGALCDQLGGDAAGVLALSEGEPVAVSLCVRGMELTGGREDFFSEIRRDIGGEDIWSGCVVAVREEYRKMHIGSELQKRCFGVIRKQGGRHLLLEIWAHPDGTEPSRGSLKLAPSYTDYGVVPDFYNIPALAGHACQICGTPCHCGARIAVLHLYPKIEYRLASRDDFEQVMLLSANYIDASEAYRAYMGALHDTLGSESMEMLAFCEGKLIGLASYRAGMHLTGERQDYFENIRRDIGDAEIWSAGFITVDPAYQGYSIGKDLQIRAFNELRAMGVSYLLAEIWCRPDGYMPSRYLMRYGSASVKEYGLVDNFYADIPRPDGVECQVCGKDCRCKALISVVKL